MSSWVIVNRETFEPILETFSQKVVDAINTDKYRVIEILPYLQDLNRRIRGGGIK